MQKIQLFLASLLAFVIALFSPMTLAAVPAEVTTAMTDAKADSLAVAALALIIIVALAAFKYMKRAV